VDGGQDPTLLGEGISVTRHPDWAFLIALASDRLGRIQLWRIEDSEPFDRTQLTFLETGLRKPMRVSPDGMRVLAATGDEINPTVAIVTLDRLED
jgi:hypothetical protein